MLSAYSNGNALPDGYISSIAQVLSQFPREVVVQCCSPVHGVARECKIFIPNAGQVHEWCEIRTEGIWERAKLETPALPPPAYDEATMAARKAQVDRVLADLAERMKAEGSWWKRFTPSDAMSILAKAERDAQQQQQLHDEDLV